MILLLIIKSTFKMLPINLNFKPHLLDFHHIYLIIHQIKIRIHYSMHHLMRDLIFI